jgi:hypothetical protein
MDFFILSLSDYKRTVTIIINKKTIFTILNNH